MRLKIPKAQMFVYLGLVLVNIYYGLNITTFIFTSIDYIMLGASALFIIHIFVFEHLNLWELIVFSVLLIIFSINYIQRGDSRILVLLMTVIAIRNMDLQLVLKVFFYVRLILFIFTVVCALGHVIPSRFEVSARGTRYALGFNHPNQFMVVVCMLIMLYVCLYYEWIKGFQLLGLTMVLMTGYLISKSQTGLITGLTVLVLLVFYKYLEIDKFLVIMGKYLPFLLMFLSLFLPYTLRASVEDFIFFRSFPKFTSQYERILRYLDSILSYRLTLSRMSLKRMKAGLFTTERIDMPSGYSVVDSGYVQLLLVYGILGTVLFLILNWLMVRKLIVMKQYIYIWAFIGMSLYAFTENVFCSLAYNFTLVFIAYLFQKGTAGCRHLAWRRGQAIIIKKR